MNVTPAGNVSVTTTSLAVFGPAFATVNVYVNAWPVSTGSGASIFVTETSASVPTGAAFTVVSSESLLLVVLLSPDDVVTTALFVIVPDAVGITTIVTVSFVPDAILFKLQLTSPL